MTVSDALPDQFQVCQGGLSPAGRPGEDGGGLGRAQGRRSLPAIRPLAEELRVNRNTVAKAYTELERQGAVENLAGKGCFVRSGTSPYRKEVRRTLLADALDDAVIQAHHLQVDRADFLGSQRSASTRSTRRARAEGS